MKKKTAFGKDMSLTQINSAQIQAIQIMLTAMLATQYSDSQIQAIKTNVNNMLEAFDNFNQASPQDFWNDMRPGVVSTVNGLLPDCVPASGPSK
ncbi:hypothetical protein IG611_01740 [Pectobacterium sp. A535-S3-A17]|uniref:hypothetical protein n=1 Tax=Pectobacterium quasiaquaticum TaxID=2774015 RepID=UPI0018737039|nr:hypothetical protein [Pectobacterium quasiaquaticum]MBE5213242.1 hypothetical protein [Pectobacterium quasiaquaticum]MBE5221640.1 hypothetical protein [Pectobacterium quasiaquaticum]MBE5224107.1 hypothetical protein [Pectobacterium quasiaquaticum]